MDSQLLALATGQICILSAFRNSMNPNYDVIVLGLGGVGSSAAAHLAGQGLRVLGIDRFSPPHAYGSSHGHTRIIRKAYFEHPDYVPLLVRAYELWRQLEQNTGEQLYFPTGLLQIGPHDGQVLSGVRRSASTHGLPIETMTMAEAAYRFPGVAGDPRWQAILEVDAGYLQVEACVRAHLRLAIQRGADLRMNEPVRSWTRLGTEVEVRTDQQTYRAKKLIIAAGPYAADCLGQYRIPLQVLRKHLYWFPCSHDYQAETGFPCFFYDTGQAYFYGFPNIGGRGLKVAQHSGGEPLQAASQDPHPENPVDLGQVVSFLESCLPGVARHLSSWQGCFYTMTPDQHFIVDRLPDNQHVILVAGLSGHGFKFTSVLGELSAQLAMEATPSCSTQFLQMDRFQST